MNPNLFADKSVLITGASSGIGAALAREFAAHGARLALVARRGDRLDALASSIASDPAANGGRRPFIVAADLGIQEQCLSAAEAVESSLGRVDVLVNNAGLGDLGPFVDSEPAAIQRMIDVNITAVATLTRRLLPGMTTRRSGWIMNIASAGGFHPMPLMAVYGATKAFVISFSEALYVELRGSGVHACCVCPGTTRTEFFDRGGFAKRRDFIYRFGAVAPEPVARMAIRALTRGKMTTIHGIGTRLQAAIVTRFLPRRLAARVVGFVLRTARGKCASP